LSQSAVGHHSFSLLLDHDSLGGAEDHQMEQAQKLMGKRILVTFAYKNIASGPERDFIGVVTKVGYGREYGNRGHIVLSGQSPTILLDAAPHIQSFGGKQPVPLSRIAHTLLKEGLGDKYPFRVDPAFTDNLTYSCQYDETHYNYLARMAEAYGEQLFYDGNKVHFGKLPPPEKAITLTFGEDVEEVSIEMRARHVNRAMYGYNSSNHELLTTGQTAISHQSSLAKVAYSISEKTFQTPSLRMAPLRAITSKNVETAQKGSTGSEAVNVLLITGTTSVPFLYPGCLVDMNLRKPGSAESSYFTRLMITEISHSVDALGNYTGHFAAIAEGTGYLPEPKFHSPIAEPQLATVTDNKDAQGRVQVRFDWQTGGTTTEWIRVMSPDAGGSAKVSKNRGFMAIPEVGDQVMVGFVHNHP
ncbi:MAG: Vgr family protein, partial [Sphingobacteriales bacterium]